MAVHIITSRNRLQKPIGEVELDWNNELVKALNPAGVWVHNKVFQRNLVDGTLVTPNNDASVIAYNAIGPQGILYPVNAVSGSTTQPCFKTGLYPTASHRTVVKLTCHVDSLATGMFYSGSHDSTRRCYLNPNSDADSSHLIFGWGSNGTGTTATRTAPTAPFTEMLSMTAQGFGTSGVTLDGYVDGNLFESRGSVSWTGTVSSSQYLLGARKANNSIDDYSITSRNRHVALLDIVAFNPVNAAVHAELALAPWQIVRPARGRIWVPVSTGSSTYTLTAANGSFNLTGNTSGLITSRLLTAAQGTFSLTGNASTLITARKITADSGSFTLTGNTANLLANRLLTATTGAFTLTGYAANLVYTPSGATYTLTAASGSFGLTGFATNLLSTRKLTAAQGLFTLTGNNTNLLVNRLLTASQGSFSLTGNAVNFSRTRVLQAASGTFNLTGYSTGLTYSGASSNQKSEILYSDYRDVILNAKIRKFIVDANYRKYLIY